MTALVLLTLVAALLRIPLLTRPMGADESASFLYYASHPLPVSLTIYGSPNNHILHSVLMRLSFLLFGREEWALRLPAFLAGVALVPLTYLAARALSERGALIAAAFSAAAPVLIDYSTDARGYTLLCCFVLLCTVAMARSQVVPFAISAALGFYTIPVMLYPFILLVIAFGVRRLAAAFKAVGLTIVLTILLYLPAVIVSGMSMLTSNPYVRPVPNFLHNVPAYLNEVRIHLFVGIPLAVQIGLAIGFAIALRQRTMATLWIGIFAVLALVAAQRVLPFPRVWLPFLILLFITAAASWAWDERGEAAVAAALVIALAITGMATPRVRETGELRAVREITRTLNRAARPGDPVLALPPSEMPLAFYCTGVEVLHPDLRRPRLFAIENRDYGQSLAKTLAFFGIDPRTVAIRKLRDFGSSALYEIRR